MVTQHSVSFPTTCVLLLNMFEQSKVDHSDKSYFPELEYEVSDQIKKIAGRDRLIKMFVDTTSDGNIWCKFRDINSATKVKDRLSN